VSSKINVLGILKQHFRSLSDNSKVEPNISVTDLILFLAMPLIVAVAAVAFNFNLSQQLSSLLVNFGSILTALLLSVLVLVYDQEHKLAAREEALSVDQRDVKSAQFVIWRELLVELYSNICYAIVVAIFLVLTCFIHGVLSGWAVSSNVPHFGDLAFYPAQIVFAPIALFLAINLVLTVLMIVKRFHKLLTSGQP